MVRVLALLVVAGAVGVGCSSTKPDQTLSVSNTGYSLDQLFTDPNGYRVYRFFDRGEFHYYVVGPKGDAQMVPSTNTYENTTEVGGGYGMGTGTTVGVGVGVRQPIGR